MLIHSTYGQGHEFAGIVEQVGSKVTTVKKGDRVFGLFSTSW